MEIIAGPIVRHSTTTEINVWFVLDDKAETVDGRLFDAAGSPLVKSAGVQVATVQLGKRLYAYLLKMVPDVDVFPTEQCLTYDLIINNHNLREMGMTSGEERICYQDGGLPGLMLKNKHEVIYHGSCRKPHARTAALMPSSQPDMMVLADDLLESTYNDPNQRASLLFLTGDQIYADDVAAPMLANIRKLCDKYIRDGVDKYGDIIPVSDSEGKWLQELYLNDRADFLSGEGMGFTSGHKDNHLLSFSEYLMMYFLVWGGVRQECPEYKEIKANLKKTEDEENDDWHLESSYPDYYQDMNICNRFLEQGWKVRRVLANTVTYMMFDDHEVTDDWNLTSNNRRMFRENHFSRHVQVNALAACWVCQGWGNTPDSFSEDEFIAPVESYLNSYDEAYFEQCEQVLHNHYWGFDLDMDPVTIVLDTRTKRSYNSDGLPRLIDRDTLAAHWERVKQLASGRGGDGTLLLVSPAPVYGFSRVERMQLLGVENDKTMATTLDTECWIADEDAFKQMQSVIVESGFNDCVIFSGDVHYGFCRYERQVGAKGNVVNIYQFTSSALHNSPGALGQVGLDMLAVAESFKKVYTSYLLPNENGTKFLNQSPNIGVLYLHDGKAKMLELNSTAPSTLRSGEKHSWYGPDGDFRWTYKIGEERKLNG